MLKTLFLLTSGWAICAISAASTEAQQQPVAHHGRVRVHFIAAEEVKWDYAPLGRDEAMGHPFDGLEKNYMEAGPHHIVSVVTRDAVEELGLKPGVAAVATVKATSVMVGRP